MWNKKKIIRAATVSGRLATLLGCSFTDVDIISRFGYLITELFARYYTKKDIVKGCMKMFIKSKEPIRKILAALATQIFDLYDVLA